MANYFDPDEYQVIYEEHGSRVVVRKELGKHYLEINENYAPTHKRFEISQEAYQSIVDQAGDQDA
jgi:hypothetical protein